MKFALLWYVNMENPLLVGMDLGDRTTPKQLREKIKGRFGKSNSISSVS